MCWLTYSNEELQELLAEEGIVLVNQIVERHPVVSRALEGSTSTTVHGVICVVNIHRCCCHV